MNLTSIDFGEILAWIIAIILFFGKVIDFDTFILFVLIKFTFKFEFRQ